ncbi:GDP-fucose protein O-fucosyltransferase 1-like [Babylonia areolata]|uniref:GDP-fucose protein O-fucosyltransferase 1-like n=1 Tax=Babylonia areolata TaxID=304850 RepID=UPI003FD19BE3
MMGSISMGSGVPTWWLRVVGVLCVLVKASLSAVSVDPSGYITYCPCMGRFGNQADQFLGSLGFAHALNRSLVLPPWVEYKRHLIKSVQVPFDVYFKVGPLRRYVRVLTMETFMKELAPTVWPQGQRIAFCYSARHGTDSGQGCNAKEGNPFESFWDTYGIDFDRSEFFQPLYYNTQSAHEVRRWKERFPPADYPVLAFTGPPAAFPVQEHHVRLHRFLHWSDSMMGKARDFIAAHVQGHTPFLGLHLRNGVDFKNACEHIKTSPSMFAAPQCIGYRSQFGTGTYEMCYPDDKAVIRQVKKEVKRIGAKAVFVATDNRDLISEFSKEMKKVKFVRQPSPADPMLDLAILGQADHFIGNCISTFTAFVKRERDNSGKTTSFWSFHPKQTASSGREDL